VKNLSNISIKKYNCILSWIIIFINLTGYTIALSSITSTNKINLIFTHLLFLIKKNHIYSLFFLTCITLTLYVPISKWKKHSKKIIFISLLLLILISFLKIPHNHLKKWTYLINYSSFRLSECTTLLFFIYLSSYLTKKSKNIKKKIWTVIKPSIILIILSIFLILKKDLKTLYILIIVTTYILILSRITTRQILSFLCSLIVFLGTFYIYKANYNFNCLISNFCLIYKKILPLYQFFLLLITKGFIQKTGTFFHNYINSKFFLTNTNIYSAFFFISQKLGYCHFFFILFINFFLPYFAMKIGKEAFRKNSLFSGFFSSSCSVWFGTQIIINMFNIPSKNQLFELSLPLISYGKASFMTICIALILLMKIDIQNKKNF